MSVTERIRYALQSIEAEQQVRILYACESGSRAWGFESAASDYDVRFLYVHAQDAYLRLDLPRDVIERPIVDDLDISGWDIFKALRLLRKSNPPLLEWLFSPVMYCQASPLFTAVLRGIVQAYYSPSALFYHYRHMVGGNYRQYIQGKESVLVKKYLYVLRPIVALLYLEQYQLIPSTEFSKNLMGIMLPEEIRQVIQALIAQKQAEKELGMGKPNPLLNAFVEQHLSRWEHIKPEQRDSRAFTGELNEVLQGILKERMNGG